MPNVPVPFHQNKQLLHPMAIHGEYRYRIHPQKQLTENSVVFPLPITEWFVARQRQRQEPTMVVDPSRTERGLVRKGTTGGV